MKASILRRISSQIKFLVSTSGSPLAQAANRPTSSTGGKPSTAPRAVPVVPTLRRPSTASAVGASSARSSKSVAASLSQERLDKVSRKAEMEAAKLAVYTDAIECYSHLCEQNHIKTFASQASDSLHPHLKEQRFELDLALLTKDDLSNTLMELLAGFRHFTEVRQA